jgi:hypothetical protein
LKNKNKFFIPNQEEYKSKMKLMKYVSETKEVQDSIKKIKKDINNTNDDKALNELNKQLKEKTTKLNHMNNLKKSIANANYQKGKIDFSAISFLSGETISIQGTTTTKANPKNIEPDSKMIDSYKNFFKKIYTDDFQKKIKSPAVVTSIPWFRRLKQQQCVTEKPQHSVM